jgi:hypothetical protein
MARANWFRSQMGSAGSVPVELAPLRTAEQWPVEWWQRDYEDPATWERGPVER